MTLIKTDKNNIRFNNDFEDALHSKTIFKWEIMSGSGSVLACYNNA